MKQKGLKFFTIGYNGVLHTLKMQGYYPELKGDSSK